MRSLVCAIGFYLFPIASRTSLTISSSSGNLSARGGPFLSPLHSSRPSSVATSNDLDRGLVALIVDVHV